MRWGLIVSLIGALGLGGALTSLEWQHFALADLGAAALELGWGAWLALLAAIVVAAASVFGLVTGRRAFASAVGVSAGLVALAFVLMARLDPSQGLVLMDHEDIAASVGTALGLLFSLFMIGGALVTRASLPRWDLAMPLPRVVTFVDGHLTHEVIAYSPRVIPLTADGIRGEVRVSREGDVHLAFDGPKTLDGQAVATARLAVPVGSRAAARSEASGHRVEVLVHHVAPPAGHARKPLIARSEVAAFALLVMTVQGAAFAAPILGWQANARRELPCAEGRCAGVMAQVEAEPIDTAMEIDMVTPDEPDLQESTTSSKAAGGPEGVFGDPRVSDPVVSKVPQRDGPMVERIDPRKVGLLALTDTKTGASDVVAEVLRGDMAATQSKIAAAMAGEGNEFVLGPGTNGLSWRGDGEGGPGDGTGRIMGQGDIDTGGPGIKTALGDPPKKRRVGELTLAPPSQTGFCRAEAIASVVKRRAAAIRACYEKSLQRKDDLAGKLTLRWTIGVDGGVENASIGGDSLGDAPTAQCVLSWVRRMKFTAPEGGVCVVQWPFIFTNR